MKAHLRKRQDWIRGRREKRKIARHARLRRQIVRYGILCSIVVACAAGFTCMPWTIKDINRDVSIAGNRVVSPDQIRQALLPSVGVPLYRLDPHLLEQRICQLPAVKYAFVRRYALPRPCLKVEVLEEFPWASFAPAPDQPVQAIISQSGRLIPLSQFPNEFQPPLKICGAPSINLSGRDIAQWDSWVRLISSQTGQPVSLVDLRQANAVEVFSGSYDLRLGAADSTLTRRLGRLASVLPVANNFPEQLRFIDLSLDANVPLKVERTASASAPL